MKKEVNMELTDQEKTTLLEIAKRAVIAKVGNRDLPRLSLDLPILKEKRGAFVTLKKGDISAAASDTSRRLNLWEIRCRKWRLPRLFMIRVFLPSRARK